VTVVVAARRAVRPLVPACPEARSGAGAPIARLEPAGVDHGACISRGRMQPWTLAHLAKHTRPLQLRVDRDRLAILEAEPPTLPRYREYLAKIYGFEVAVETTLLAVDGFDARLVRTHLKTHLLAGDLERLGLSTHRILPFEPVTFDGVAEALGWLYALQHSALAHGVIRRYLASRLPIADTCTYLCATEGRAGALMRQLGAVLDSTTRRRPSNAERMCLGACDAYRLQHHYYRSDPIVTPRRAA
jgi:heme oxygenase